DFRPGGNFVLDMQRAAAETDKTLVVLSEDYLNAEFTQPEWAAAFADDPTSLQRKVIPVRVGDCKPSGLLRPIVYVDLVDLEADDARQAILDALPERLKPESEPAFPKANQSKKPNKPPAFPAAKPWNVPYERNPFFTGRESVLQTLHQQLNQDCAVAISQIQAISGLGGIGKTQTAVEYAYRYRDEYEAVFWVRADTEVELSSGFGAIAQLLDLPQKDEPDAVVQAVKLWLTRNSNWLLIFDNADRPELVQDFKPRLNVAGVRGHLLITSRAQDFQDLGIARPLEMETLEPEEALDFLWRRAGRGELSDQQNADIKAAQQLAAELGYLPLALEQAAAYIVAKKARFQDYLASYQKRKLARLETAKPKLGKYPDSIATTWTLNFQQVEKASPASADLLRVSALLHPDAIPFELLTQGGSQLGDALAEALADVAEDPLAVNEVLEPLCTYSLIRVDQADQTYSIHRLVQEVCRAEMETDETCQLWLTRTVFATNQLMPEDEDEGTEYQDIYQYFNLFGRITNHAQVLAQFCQTLNWQSLEAARLFNGIGNYLREQGPYSLAESLLQQAYQLYQDLLEGDHRGLSNSLNYLAALYYNQGRYSEAEPLLQEALAMRKRLLGDDHPSVATNLNNLAILYNNQGRYSEAEPLLQEALAMRKRLLGDDHPDVAMSLSSLAILYNNQGRYSEAEPLLQEALAMRKRLLGDDHPDVAMSLSSLATLYCYQARYSEAEPLIQEAVMMQKRLLGDNHLDVAINLSSLAGLYNNQGRYSEAELLYQETLAMYKQLFDDHPGVAASLNSLAILYNNQGRYSEAEPLIQEALAMRKRLLGNEHPDVATSLNSLATLYQSQDRYEDAKLLFIKTVKLRRELLGKKHPHLASSLNNLARCYREQQDYEQAEVLCQEALEIAEKSLPREHELRGRFLDDFGKLRAMQGLTQEAETIYQQALEILESKLGVDHPWTVRCRERLNEL
ncbi:MAG: tetratricopeptide repeat protein, partial [Cyanobacteria bacterium P01_F01_bin.116]